MRPYQEQALASWLAAKKRGVVVLPTGAGKSYLALRALLAAARSTLVLAPTIELVEQWVRELSARRRTSIRPSTGAANGGWRR